MMLVSNGRLNVWGKALVCVVTAWALCSVMPDWIRTWPFGATVSRLPVEVDDSGVVQSVDASALRPAPIPAGRVRTHHPAPGAPLMAAGDRIGLDRHNCLRDGFESRVCTDLFALYGGSGGIQFLTLHHPPVQIYDVNRGGAVLITPVPADEPWYAKILLALDQLGAMAFIGLSALLVWRRPSPVTTGFFLYSGWFNPGQTYVGYALVQPYPPLAVAQEVVQAIVVALGLVGFLVFALRFPDADVPLRRWERIALPALAIVLLLVQGGTFLTPFGARSAGTFANALTVLETCISIAVIPILIVRGRSMRRHDRPLEFQRTRLVWWVLGIALPPYVIAELIAQAMLPASWLPQSPGDQDALVYALFIPSALMPFVVFEAVRRCRVVDVRFTFARGTTLALTGILWLVVFAFAEVEIEHGMSDTAGGLVLLILLVVVSISFEHIRHGLNWLCDVLFFRRLHRAESDFKDAAADIDEAENVDALERLIVDRPLRTLQLASAAVFRREGATLRRVRESGWNGESAADLRLTDPVLAPIIAEGKPRRIEPPVERADFPSGAATPALIVPMRAHKETLAVAVFGGHAQGDALVKEEEALLCSFVDEATTAYREATLRARIVELERTQGTRTPVSPA
ncbi:MAG TPA: hypothetical protein VHT05_06330 [Candidatus Elarobacter sp.]|nr:hypothetical protein [Candidatus Elarobacter sp.]